MEASFGSGSWPSATSARSGFPSRVGPKGLSSRRTLGTGESGIKRSSQMLGVFAGSLGEALETEKIEGTGEGWCRRETGGVARARNGA